MTQSRKRQEELVLEHLARALEASPDPVRALATFHFEELLEQLGGAIRKDVRSSIGRIEDAFGTAGPARSPELTRGRAVRRRLAARLPASTRAHAAVALTLHATAADPIRSLAAEGIDRRWVALQSFALGHSESDGARCARILRLTLDLKRHLDSSDETPGHSSLPDPGAAPRAPRRAPAPSRARARAKAPEARSRSTRAASSRAAPAPSGRAAPRGRGRGIFAADTRTLERLGIGGGPGIDEIVEVLSARPRLPRRWVFPYRPPRAAPLPRTPREALHALLAAHNRALATGATAELERLLRPDASLVVVSSRKPITATGPRAVATALLQLPFGGPLQASPDPGFGGDSPLSIDATLALETKGWIDRARIVLDAEEGRVTQILIEVLGH